MFFFESGMVLLLSLLAEGASGKIQEVRFHPVMERLPQVPGSRDKASLSTGCCWFHRNTDSCSVGI